MVVLVIVSMPRLKMPPYPESPVLPSKVLSVSVIVPTYYRYDYLAEVLEKLCHQTIPPHEVIVPDQTPSDERPHGFYERFDKRITLNLLYVEQPSLTVPRNIAARKASGEILLFLDDDTVIPESLIEAHLRVMDRENVDVVNGAVSMNDTLPDRYPWDVTVLDPVRFFIAAPNYRWNGMMIGVSSCNFSIKRDTFHAVGGFDENLPRMVDFELGYRLFRSGAKIYFSHEPFAQHLRAPGGSRKNPRSHNRVVAALYIHKKHFPGWITTQWTLMYLATAFIRRRNIVEPWYPFVRTYGLIRANRIVNRMLKGRRVPWENAPVHADGESDLGRLSESRAIE